MPTETPIKGVDPTSFPLRLVSFIRRYDWDVAHVDDTDDIEVEEVDENVITLRTELILLLLERSFVLVPVKFSLNIMPHPVCVVHIRCS